MRILSISASIYFHIRHKLHISKVSLIIHYFISFSQVILLLNNIVGNKIYSNYYLHLLIHYLHNTSFALTRYHQLIITTYHYQCWNTGGCENQILLVICSTQQGIGTNNHVIRLYLKDDIYHFMR